MGTRTRMSLGVLAAAVALVALAGPALAGHWWQQGWRDGHVNYQQKPSGYNGIVSTFGQPCSSAASKIWMYWRAADNGHYYRLDFHRKLGGRPTAFVSNKGGTSTNLDNDVRGHIGNAHLDGYVRHGIWGYLCRYISGTRKWSTHAWGIAVDVSSAHEPNGQCWSSVNHAHRKIWQDHRWTWGKQWCDPMHFQYAKNY